MGAALGLSLIYLGVMRCGSKAPRRLLVAGTVAGRVVLLLFPPAARDALALLNCTATTVSSAGCASLNGCSSSGGSASSRGLLVTVSVLALNNFYLCWAKGGAHAAAGGLAIATLIFVVAAFPTVSFWAVCQRARRSDKQRDRHSSGKEIPGISAVVVNPMRQIKARGDTEDTGADDLPPLLAPFLSDYRPETWYTRLADLALTLILAALQVRGFILKRPAPDSFSLLPPLARRPSFRHLQPRQRL